MIISPDLVLFAIRAGAQLGHKISQVLLDETVEKPLLLPVGELYGDVSQADADEFFSDPDNAPLTAPGGPYHGFSPEEKLLAFKTLTRVQEAAQDSIEWNASEVVLNLHRMEQVKKEYGVKSPATRLLGTVVEIGIDYLAFNPSVMGLKQNSPAARVVSSLVAGLDEADFSESSHTEIVGDVMMAALATFEKNSDLVHDDKRVQVLLGGVSAALVRDLSEARSTGEKIHRDELARRLASSLIRGGVCAFSENVGIFLQGGSREKRLIESALSQVLEGIRDKEDLFTTQSIETLFHGALMAVSENAELFSNQQVVRELIHRTLGTLNETSVKSVFGPETLTAVLRESMNVVREHADTLIAPSNPKRQFLAEALGALAGGLADSTLAGSGGVRNLFSKAQLVDLARRALAQVAQNPGKLLGADGTNPRRTALAQIVGSVAHALSEAPPGLTTGERMGELIEVCLGAAMQNLDKLIDLKTEGSETNLLYKIIRATALSAKEAGDPRGIMTPETFNRIVFRLLPVASARIDAIESDGAQAVKTTLTKVLQLASGEMADGIHSGNIPRVTRDLLAEVLWGELKMDDAAAVKAAAEKAVRASVLEA